MSDLPFRSSDDWLEPLGPSARLPGTTQLPTGYTPLGGGVVWSGPNVPLTPEQAQKEAFGLTGIPNIQGALGALGRKEYLPAFGQGMWGALQMAGLISPAARAVEGLPLLEALADVRGGPTAYHGTEAPAFDRFSNEFIGSGEGSQAYGWGHYVAGNPKVAESYIPHPFEGNEILYNGQPLSLVATEPHIALAGEYLRSFPIKNGIPDFEKAKEWMNGLAESTDPNSPHVTQLNNAVKWIDENRDNISGRGTGGSLLEVKILPEEHELLDWDKQLKDQPQQVQEALQPFINGLTGESTLSLGMRGVELKHRPRIGNVTGADIYKSLQNVSYTDSDLGGDAYSMVNKFGRGAEAVSKALHEAGIPGIRYLDQGSRNSAQEQMLQEQLRAGLITQEEYNIKTQATRNYVIFDPSNLQITARNGQKLEPVDHDPFQGGQ